MISARAAVEPSTRSVTARTSFVAFGALELTRFCGHLSIGGFSPPEGSPHGKDTTAIHAGVPR